MAAVKALHDEFEPLPAPSKPKAVQLISVNGFLYVLMSDGKIYTREEDKSKLGQPFGPHWAWFEINGP